MGPSSSGGVAIVQLLNLLEGFDLPKMGFLSSTTISVMAETMKLVYADRAEYLGDSDFYGVPVEWLISKKYADVRRKLINTEMATPSIKISFGKKPSEESEYTTHYSIIDSRGNAVSVTTTINSSFGSKVVVDGAGFLLNNEMDDFSAKPGIPNQFGLIGGEANSIQPRKRMLSAMTPTIVTKDGKPVIIVGSPGGSTIISTVLQVLVNIIDFGMNIQEAIDAPRIHHQWLPDTLYYERRSLANDILINLGKKGYNLLERNGYQGRVDGIIIDNKKGIIYGATDPRGDGEALGY
jgi:gamma-glutamyltranspeptidase/glutathione hydrolase